VWLARDGQPLLNGAFGATTYDNSVPEAPVVPVTIDTIYDIASLSKLWTLSAFLIAARENKVDVHAPLSRFFPEFGTDDKRAITLRQLLNHSSGIAIAIQSFTPRPTIEGDVAQLHSGVLPVEEWIARIAQAPLHNAPGQEVLYSCTNYFLLARLIEKWSGRRLDEFIRARLIAPLGLQRTTFEPLKEFGATDIAPTEINPDTQAPWLGIVHDEAAREWQVQTGGACGNAGVFSNAADLAVFAALWQQEGAYQSRQILHPDDVRQSYTDTIPEGDVDSDQSRGWCWQVDANYITGEKAPRGTAGHTGFTGPSFWLHPRVGYVCIVINNRVYPTRNGPNRLPFHRAISAALLAYN
ncbi:MAG: hypothetical protein JWN98_1419, partial [Abditibacteriota bacterium]|nr:hypothetical protein [Abditibacteriota bacterium]